jgi:hypothetical protein
MDRQVRGRRSHGRPASLGGAVSGARRVDWRPFSLLACMDHYSEGPGSGILGFGHCTVAVPR